MATLEIITLPDPRLHQASEPITAFDASLKKLVADMGETMHAANGIGLAAVQVAIMKQVIVVDISDMGCDDDEAETAESRKTRTRHKRAENVEAYINPKIIRSSGEIEYEEGCLSIPGVYSKVKRFNNVTVEYSDVDGNVIEEEAEGLKAIVLQHEIDHINGVVFFDRVGPMQRIILQNKYKKLHQRKDAED